MPEEELGALRKELETTKRNRLVEEIRKLHEESGRGYSIVPNILNRDFESSEPNRKWVSDITYIATGEGWLYLQRSWTWRREASWDGRQART